MYSHLRPCSRMFFRAVYVMLIAWILGSASLQAQVDPRLWKNAKTDFLDLFQQSTSTVMKPEIATVFDFSGSMAALMYHPAYYTTTPLDAGEGTNAVSFTLNPGASGSYTLVATSSQNTAATAQADLAVNGGTSNFSNTGPKSTNSGTRTTTLSNLTVNPLTGHAPGSTVTVSVTVTIQNSSGSSKSVDNGITWSGGGSFSPASAGGAYTIAANTTKSWTYTTTWTVPAAPAIPVKGSFPSNSSLTLVALIKPDGSVVTPTNAATVATGSGLSGAGSGANDVRNWIRAASHARFTNGTRTVDIPIPWKSMDSTSTGNPLTSAYCHDPVGGTDVELDRCYAINSGDLVLDNNATTSSLRSTSFDSTYITWLFNGKYQNTDATRPDYSPTYSGQYIVFASAGSGSNLAGGQDSAHLSWGQGFGTNFSSMDKIALSASNSVLASRWIVPARTRAQAVKEAAVRTWLKYQGKVLSLIHIS